MLIFKNIKEDKKDIYKIKELYESSFPEDEQVPFFHLENQAYTSISDIYGVYDHEFIGLLVNVYYEDILFLWYIAIEPKFQNKGYGSLILKQIQNSYPNHRIVLNIELVDNNNPIQIKRKHFYIKNGFKECGFYTEEYGVFYEMLYYHQPITYQEYEKMMRNFSGDEVFDQIYKQAFIK